MPIKEMSHALTAVFCCVVGRVDAQKPDAPGRLPAEDFSADRLKQAFQQQGLSVQEFVALAGAHTVRLR